MPTPAAEPTPGPIFVLADTVYRIATAVLAASVLAFLLVLVAGVLVEEVHPDPDQVWPAYLLIRELIGVTIIGAGIGAAVIGPARTARQVALGALLIKAEGGPSVPLVTPDPRGPVGRSPFLPATVTAVALIIGGLSTLAVLSEEPTAPGARTVVVTVLVTAVIALPLLVIAGRRWRSRSAPLLDGQLAAPSPEPGPSVRTVVARATARPVPLPWVPWLFPAGLVIFLGALFLRRPGQDSERLSFGETADSVIELALLTGGGLIAAAVLFTVIRLLVRAAAESIGLRRLTAEPSDPGHPAPAPDLTGVAPATRAGVLIIGAATWLGELIFGLARLAPVQDPVLTDWHDRLPDLLTGWWVIMVLAVAATAAAGILDCRSRNRARGAEL